MANVKFFSAAMIVLAGMFFVNSCDKAALSPMEASNGYDSNAGKKVVKVTDPDDKLVDEVPSTEVKVVGDSLIFTVTTTSVYVTPEGKNKEVKNAPERFSLLAIEGVEDQYFDYTGNYTTSRAAASYKEGAEYQKGNFHVTPRDSVNTWNASNDTHNFTHQTTTHFAKVVWVRYNETLNKDITYTFNLKPSVKESTSHPAANVEHEGKTYTMSYASEVTASYEGVEGSASVTNKAYLRNIPDNYTQEFKAQEYVGNFKVSNVSNFETEDQHNAYVRRTYNNGQLTEEKTFNLPLVLSAKLTRTSGARENVEEFKNNLGVSMALAGAAQTTFGEPDENGYRAQRVTRNYTLRVSDGARYNLEVIVENTVKNGEDVLEYAWFNEIEPVISLQPKFNASESTASNPVSDVEVSVNLNVARTTRGQVQTKAAADEKEPYTIMASHQEVMTVADELVSSREEKVVTPKANGFDVVARFFETYSLSGEKMVSEQSGEMLFDINGSNGTAMVVKNVNFNTTGNGHNGIGNGTYSNTATNGTDSFNNSYSYSADNSKSFSYNGKTVTFTADFKIVENGQSIGSKTSSNGYDVYPYSNEVKGIYTVEGQSVEKTAAATRELRVEQVVENLIGDIVSAGMSVVPSLKSGSSYVDGSGKRVATKCLTIRRANGTAAAIVFAYETENVILPTDAQIKGGNWVSGNYNDAYNSGVFMNGNWIPAVAKDENYGISYSIPTQSNIRSIRNETLKQWGWRGGNYSTKLSAYNVTVENGVCTIYYNGEVVKRFR